MRDRFLPALSRHVTENLPGQPASLLTFEVDEATHSPVLLFAYPRVGQTGSLRPQVKLEFGSLYDQRPTGTHTIKSLTAEVFPALFREPSCPVVALEADLAAGRGQDEAMPGAMDLPLVEAVAPGDGFGMDVPLAHPQGYDLIPAVIKVAQKNATASGGRAYAGWPQ